MTTDDSTPAPEPDEADFSAISVRIPVAVKERLETLAKREERTASGFIRFHLPRLLDEIEAEAVA